MTPAPSKDSLADSELPDLLILGVHRAGTTMLIDVLSEHREVQRPRWKELRALEPLCWGSEPDFGIYRRAFGRRDRPEQLLIEATPTYAAMGAIAAKEIATWENQPRVVLMLRSPGRQFASHLTLNLRSGKLAPHNWVPAQEACLASWADGNRLPYHGDGSANHAWFLAEALYSEYLDEWAAAFGERLIVVISEGLWSSPQTCGAHLLRRLGLGAQDLPWHLVRNAQSQRRTTGRLTRTISELLAHSAGDHSSIYRAARHVRRIGRIQTVPESGPLIPAVKELLARHTRIAVERLEAMGEAVVGLEGLTEWSKANAG